MEEQGGNTGCGWDPNVPWFGRVSFFETKYFSWSKKIASSLSLKTKSHAFLKLFT